MQRKAGFKEKQVPLAPVLDSPHCRARANPQQRALSVNVCKTPRQLLPHHNAPAPSRNPHLSPRNRQETSPLTLCYLERIRVFEFLFLVADALEEALAGASLPPCSVPGPFPSIGRPKSCPGGPGTPGQRHSGAGGREASVRHHGAPWDLGALPAPSTLPRALRKTLEIIPPGEAQSGGRQAFNTPRISLKLFCLHHPDAEEHPAR